MSHLRMKWMRLKIRDGSGNVFDFIRNAPYSDEIGAGFTKCEVLDNGITATFNKKLVVLEPVLDPFGDIVEYERIVFDHINFSLYKLSNRVFLITFYNPPKTVKSFIDFLSQAEGLRVSYGNISVNLKDFLTLMRVEFGVKVFGIPKVKISNFPISEKTKAALELNSSGDALTDLKEFTRDENFTLEKIKMVGFILSSKVSFEISSSACATVPEEHFKLFNEAIGTLELTKL